MMDNTLKDKKLGGLLAAVSLLALIVSVFFIVKTVNEIKANKYIGDESQYPNVIYVSGKGEVNAVSDIASISLTINKEDKTAKAAQDLLNKEVTKVLGYLKDQSIEDKDIKSEYGGLSPKYSYGQTTCYTYPCPRKDPKIVGYTATQTITVKVRNVDKSNEIKTGLSDLGVTNITGPTFSIDNEDNYKEQARALAIKDAKAKAGVLADQLGIKLGKIINFSESNDGNRPVAYKAAAMDSTAMAESSAPTLPKGENKITSNVTITYEIR